MRKNTGEELKMQNSYELSACGSETALAVEMRERCRRLGRSAIKPIEFGNLGPILTGHDQPY